MASKYAWTITKDLLPPLEGCKSCAMVYGPSGSPLKAAEIAARPDGKKFRLLTDDGEPMVEGVLVELEKDATTGFEPLDDYGYGGLGATRIDYLESGVWKQL